MKKTLFSVIRQTHKILASKELPNHLGLYFHEMEPHQWDAFFQAITYFTDLGYVALSSADYIKAPAEQKCLFISFDDNYKSWHAALPLFKECNIKATFYVNTLPLRDLATKTEITDYFDRIDHQGERITLSTAELKDLSDQGHEIGAHTHSHFVLSSLEQEQWDIEISRNKTQLEDIIGKDVTSFSYPYGMRRHFSKELHAFCLENGFQTIAAAIPGLLYRDSDTHTIHRTRWHLHKSVAENIVDLSIDGQFFEKITGRSAIG